MLTSVDVTEIHGRKEGHNGNTLGGVHLNEPIKVLLENFIIVATIGGKDSIQTRFGGVRLPTTVKQADETFTDLSNFVAVETNNGDGFFFVEVYGSVARLPVDAVSDGVVHLVFDLTHDKESLGRL